MVASETVAAVIVEPILGEGGFVVPPADFFPGADGDLPQARRPGYRGRSAERVWPHRPLFAMRTLWHRARSYDYGESLGWRTAAGSRSPDARKSWTPRPRASSAAHLPAIRSPARPHLRCSTSIEKENLNARANDSGRTLSEAGDGMAIAMAVGRGHARIGRQCKRSNWFGRTTRQPADEETKQVTQYCYEHGLV